MQNKQPVDKATLNKLLSDYTASVRASEPGKAPQIPDAIGRDIMIIADIVMAMPQFRLVHGGWKEEVRLAGIAFAVGAVGKYKDDPGEGKTANGFSFLMYYASRGSQTELAKLRKQASISADLLADPTVRKEYGLAGNDSDSYENESESDQFYQNEQD